MDSLVAPERIRLLNDASIRPGKYVLYWMQASHRTEENPALTYAVERANAASLPLVVYFGIYPGYPGSNLRHFTFLLEGLSGVSRSLEEIGARFILLNENPLEGILDLAGHAAVLVMDRGYARLSRSWCREAARRCRCPAIQVEANAVVPVETASTKEEYSAATFRKRIAPLWKGFLTTTRLPELRKPFLYPGIPTLAGQAMGSLVSGIDTDHSVPPSPVFRGGTVVAEHWFERFIADHLEDFGEERNDPGRPGGSGMSPYLHYGQVSPVHLARMAIGHGGMGVPAFLEELIVRRELAINFVHYNEQYDSYGCLPAWAQRTLREHQGDPHLHTYSRSELEQGKTHDPYWNAAQAEMVATGKMQGYMRMYWGKKILEWSASPEEAYRTALSLNNRYELDGRGPNAFAGVAWCFGKHDRPWGERPVFGKVRYMNEKGLLRKFDMQAYVSRIHSRGSPGPAAGP